MSYHIGLKKLVFYCPEKKKSFKKSIKSVFIFPEVKNCIKSIIQIGSLLSRGQKPHEKHPANMSLIYAISVRSEVGGVNVDPNLRVWSLFKKVLDIVENNHITSMRSKIFYNKSASLRALTPKSVHSVFLFLNAESLHLQCRFAKLFN